MGKFVIRKTAAGYKFDLRAANGQVIAASEVYAARAACVKGISGVIACAATAPAADLTREGKLPSNPRFEIFADKQGAYRFRLRARNGKVIAVSQGYSSRTACENGVESVRRNVAGTDAENIEITG